MAELGGKIPQYKCHKKVGALKIASFVVDGEGGDRETDGSAIITPEDKVAPFRVDLEWRKRNPKAEAGGYFVVYERQPGDVAPYTAYSPADAFEDGYTRI